MPNSFLVMCTQELCESLTNNILNYMRPESQCPRTTFYRKFLLMAHLFEMLRSGSVVFRITVQGSGVCIKRSCLLSSQSFCEYKTSDKSCNKINNVGNEVNPIAAIPVAIHAFFRAVILSAIRVATRAVIASVRCDRTKKRVMHLIKWKLLVLNQFYGM